MGAVVGGLYAVGYSADMIDSLIQIQDWNRLMRDIVSREHVPAVQRGNHNRYVVSLPYNLPFGEKSGGVSLPPCFYWSNIYNFLNTIWLSGMLTLMTSYPIWSTADVRKKRRW